MTYQLHIPIQAPERSLIPPEPAPCSDESYIERTVECAACGYKMEVGEHYIELDGEAICQNCEMDIVIHKVV